MNEILQNDTTVISNNTTNSQVLVWSDSSFWWAFLDVLLFLIIVCGNILTILAVRLSRRLRHVVSNYLILNLAISDLLVGLTLLYHLAFYFSETINKTIATCVLRVVMISLGCCASVYNVSAIAADRYIAIIYPFSYSTQITKKVIFTIISIGWFSSITIATMPVYWNDFDDTVVCELDTVLPRYYVVALLTPLFCIAWISVLTIYTKIWIERNVHVRRLKTNGVHTNDSSGRKSAQVVILITGCFSICWLPYLCVACTRAFDWYKKSTPTLYKVAFSLAMVNSGMNPMIYAWKNSNFRKAFLRLLHFRSPNYHYFNYSFKHYLKKQSELTMKTIQNDEETELSQETA